MGIFEFIKNIFEMFANNTLLLCAIIAVSAVLQQFFPPYPGDTVMIVCGIMSVEYPNLSLMLYMPYFLGTYFSSLALYHIGKKYGARILASKTIQKFITAEKLGKIVQLSNKIDGLGLFLFKFIAGANSLALLWAGVSNIAKNQVKIYMGFAAFIQNTLLFIAGKTIGDNHDMVAKFFKRTNGAAIAAVLIIILAGALYYKKRKAATNSATKE